MRALTRFAGLLALPLLGLAGCAETTEDVAPATAHPHRRVVVVEAAPVAAVPVVVAPVVAAPVVVAPAAPRVVEVPGAERVSPMVVAPPPAPHGAAIETWATRHPDAAKSLGAWVHDNPEAAKRVFEFDAAKPDRSKMMIAWALAHPKEDIMALVSQHPDWPWFDDVSSKHRVGMDQLLAWVRAHPAEAEELMSHPSGLRWVGDHLYSAEWHG